MSNPYFVLNIWHRFIAVDEDEFIDNSSYNGSELFYEAEGKEKAIDLALRLNKVVEEWEKENV